MLRSSIVYAVCPSFDEGKQFTVSVAWDDHRRQYRLAFSKGYEANKLRWIDESPQLSAILQSTVGLHLPFHATGQIGLDGTTYRFIIGQSPSVTFTWWETLPNEWASLGKIIEALHAIVESQ